jgi:hypothetical protein
MRIQNEREGRGKTSGAGGILRPDFFIDRAPGRRGNARLATPTHLPLVRATSRPVRERETFMPCTALHTY